jgi:hypothetical protein
MNRPILVLPLLVAVSPFWLSAGNDDVGRESGNWAARVASAESVRDANIREVKSIRRYVLHNPRWKNDAVATVRFTSGSNGRKRYNILDLRAEGLQKQILQRILDGEVETAAKKEEDPLISPRNYEVTPVGYENLNGRRCQIVNLKPRRKTRTLIEGRAWIDVKEAAPVRIEGRTAKSLSFWVGRPYIVLDFRKVGDFWLSAENHSTADVKLLGKTELTIHFLDYSITPKDGGALMACAGTCSPRLID